MHRGGPEGLPESNPAAYALCRPAAGGPVPDAEHEGQVFHRHDQAHCLPGRNRKHCPPHPAPPGRRAKPAPWSVCHGGRHSTRSRGQNTDRSPASTGQPVQQSHDPASHRGTECSSDDIPRHRPPAVLRIGVAKKSREVRRSEFFDKFCILNFVTRTTVTKNT